MIEKSRYLKKTELKNLTIARDRSYWSVYFSGFLSWI